jgi:hypothetical protein
MIINGEQVEMSQEDYQTHMDALAKKVAATLKGVRLEDGISACAACIGFGMVQIPPGDHAKMRVHIGRIIDAIIANVPKPQ